MKFIIYLISIMSGVLVHSFIANASDFSEYSPIIKDNSSKNSIELNKLGYKNLEVGRFDDALALYTLSISKWNDNGSEYGKREYIKALNNVGYIHLFVKNNPEKAYPYFIKARQLAEKEGYNDLISATLDNIAKVHDDFGDIQKAIDTYNLAMEYAAKAHTEVSAVIQLMVFNDMVNCAIAHEMISDIKPSLMLFSELPEYSIPMGKYSKEMCDALLLLIKGDIRHATTLIRNAGILINSRTDSVRYVVDHNLTLANLYHLRNMGDSANAYLTQALQYAKFHNLNDRLPRIFRGLASVAASKGDSIESRERLLQAYQADEKIHTSKMYASLSTLEATNEIDNLNIMLREADIRHAHRVRVIWILVVAITLIIILLIFIFIRNHHLSNSLRELVIRHQASINQEEVNRRLRHQYVETIENLKKEVLSLQPAKDTMISSKDTMSEEEEEASKIRKKIILPVNDSEQFRIIGEVTEIFTKSNEIFNPLFSLERLAELTNTKPRYLSTLLNDSMGKSFNVLLAEARVREACELLLSPDFKKTTTIEMIASQVGYRSRTHFTSVFKKITGVSPLKYIEMMKKS